MNRFLLTITIEAGSTVGVLLSDVVHLLVCAADLIWWDIRKVLRVLFTDTTLKIKIRLLIVGTVNAGKTQNKEMSQRRI